MKLYEIMSVGDDNVLGRAFSDARKTLKKLKDKSDKEICELACGLLSILDNLEANANLLQTDGYSLMNYLKQLGNSNIGKNTLRLISDTLGSYSDSDGE